jgi:hypothetical protein
MDIIDRSNELPPNLSKIDKSTAQWVYAADNKPRGDYSAKQRDRQAPQGYRPPWKPKAQRDADAREKRQARRAVTTP